MRGGDRGQIRVLHQYLVDPDVTPVAWKAAPSVFVDGVDKGPDFSISPAQADVAAGGSQDFRVQYTPRRDNTYSLV